MIKSDKAFRAPNLPLNTGVKPLIRKRFPALNDVRAHNQKDYMYQYSTLIISTDKNLQPLIRMWGYMHDIDGMSEIMYALMNTPLPEGQSIYDMLYALHVPTTDAEMIACRDFLENNNLQDVKSAKRLRDEVKKLDMPDAYNKCLMSLCMSVNSNFYDGDRNE
jgi:hypothetical protein